MGLGNYWFMERVYVIGQKQGCTTMERVVGRALAKKFLSFDRPEWTPIIESNSSIACRQ